MKVAVLIARILLGIVFLVFGSNGFLHFIPMPPPQGQAGNFTMALFTSGYFYVIAALQVAGGALMLLGRYIPLALMLLGPVIVNILLFHIFLAPSGIPLAAIVSFLSLFLLWAYKDRFAPILKP